MKYAKNIAGTIEVFKTLPGVYNGKQNYQSASEETHKADGFFPLIEPEYDAETQRLDNLHKVNNTYTYDIVGIPIQEINQNKANQIKKAIENNFGKILNGAKAILMGKTLEDDLDYYENVYRTKYEYCKNNLNDTDLQLEFSLENISGVTTLQEYKAYVIAKFEGAELLYKGVQQKLETLRKKILKDIEETNFTIAFQRLEELENLTISLSPSEFQNVFENILNL